MSLLIFAGSREVSEAVNEITATLNWMRSSKTTGGLGYSVARVRQTHAHKALVALGATWTPLR